MKSTFYTTGILLILFFSSCKKCPESDLDPGTPLFIIYILNKETNQPLITDDSTSTFPIGSIKLVDKNGNGWEQTNRPNTPFGPKWLGFIYPHDAHRESNDTSHYYIHFRTTGDIDTIKVYSRIHEHECDYTYSFRFYYNNDEVPIDSTEREFTQAPLNYLTIKKQL